MNEKIDRSAGLLLIHNNRILLCHPTGSPWFNTFTIPKGKIEKNESIIEGAIRETYEETSILIDKNNIKPKNLRIIEYKNKGTIYKKLFYYPIYLNNDIKNLKLQKDEIDWAGFLTKKEAKNKIFWRFKEMLSFIQ